MKLELQEFYAKDFKDEEEKLKKEGIVNFWNKKKIKSQFPNVYSLAPIIFSVPATQCSVERLFSNFSFILNKFRTKLGTTDTINILTEDEAEKRKILSDILLL